MKKAEAQGLGFFIKTGKPVLSGPPRVYFPCVGKKGLLIRRLFLDGVID